MSGGLNDTADSFLAAIARGEAEVAPSSLYAAAALLEGVAFINGSPQNTFVPGLIELAVERGTRPALPLRQRSYRAGRRAFRPALWSSSARWVACTASCGCARRERRAAPPVWQTNWCSMMLQQRVRCKRGACVWVRCGGTRAPWCLSARRHAASGSCADVTVTCQASTSMRYRWAVCNV